MEKLNNRANLLYSNTLPTPPEKSRGRSGYSAGAVMNAGKKLLAAALLFGLLLLAACDPTDKDDDEKSTDKPATSYTVTFDTDGGSTIGAVEVTPGQPVPRPEDPSKGDPSKGDELAFVNWYTTKTQQVEKNLYDFSTPINSNLTLYARWTDRFNTVIFNYTFPAKTRRVLVITGRKITEPSPAPARNKFVFGGWYTHKTEQEGDTNKFEFDRLIAQNYTLHPKWTPGPKPADKVALQNLIDAAKPTDSLNHIDTSLIADMSNLFKDKTNFNGDISGWDLSAVTNMHSMFLNAAAFDQNLSDWQPTKINYARRINMFVGATAMLAARDKWPDWDGDGTAGATGVAQTPVGNDFIDRSWQPPARCEAIAKTEFPADRAALKKLTDAAIANTTAENILVAGQTQKQKRPSLNHIDTSKVTNMHQLFQNKKTFNGALDCWNTANVVIMRYMFTSATVFNQDISGWNTAAFRDMAGMFQNARAFNLGRGVDEKLLWDWNTAAVTDMENMFYYAFAFNRDIGNWNTAAVRDMLQMFEKAKKFNQDLSDWQVGKVTSRKYIFDDSLLDHNAKDISAAEKAARLAKHPKWN